MNAALDNDQVKVPRRLMGLDKAALEQKLHDWGDWLERRLDHEGYPQTDAVAAALDGAGGGQPGHRILFPSMPHRLWSIHHRILRLPEHEHAAIVVWYIPSIRGEPPRQYAVYKEDLDRNGWERWYIHERGGDRVLTAEIFLTFEQADARRQQLVREDLRNFGRPWTTAEKAARLGIEVDALYKRLERARLRLLGVLPLL